MASPAESSATTSEASSEEEATRLLPIGRAASALQGESVGIPRQLTDDERKQRRARRELSLRRLGLRAAPIEQRRTSDAARQALERRRRAARTLPRSKSATNLGARAWLGSPNLGASPLVAEQAGSSVDRRARLHSIEFQALSQRLAAVERAVDRLSVKVQTQESDNARWSVRYSGRLVFLSNVMLGIWMGLTRFTAMLATRSTDVTGPIGWFFRWLQVRFPHAFPADKVRSRSTRRWSSIAFSLPQSARPAAISLMAAFLGGGQSALWFFFCAFLNTRPNSGWRDLGLLLSMSTSLYLIASRRDVAWANYFNVFFHLVFLLARDFFIKALFSFRGLKFG